MPPSKSGSNLREVNRWQRDAARAEYLRHPDYSIAEVAKATNVAPRTVARARKALVREGLLPAGRNATTGADAAVLAVAAREISEANVPAPQPEEAAQTPVQPTPSPTPQPRGKPAQTIDAEALRKMDEVLDELADEDDDSTRKRMLRQVKRFAFDPNLHPDTRMSASTLWAKLLDMQRQKDIGPGIPLTLDAAIVRATDFCRAAGPKVMVPAFYAAFDLGDPNGTQAVVEGTPTPPTPAAVGPTDNDPQVRNEA